MPSLPWYLGNSRMIGIDHPFSLVFLLLWSLIWKGLALWHAGRREEKGWFVILLVVNTAGILELIYLLFVAKIFTKESKTRRSHKK